MQPIRILIGGSPCTHWSIAQKNNRETTAEGEGWELFKNYLIAKEKFKPDFFLYENNKSAAQSIKDQIGKELGIETDDKVRLTHINSALVSAQNRQRFYVTNFGDINQPKDRGIVLKDILEPIVEEIGYELKNIQRVPDYGTEKSRPITAHYPNNFGGWPDRIFNPNPAKQQIDLIAEPINICENGKSHTIKVQYYKNGTANFITNGGSPATAVAEPVCIASRGRGGNKSENKEYIQSFEPRTDGKTNALTSVQKDNLVVHEVKDPNATGWKHKRITKLVAKHGYLPKIFNLYNLSEIEDKTPTITSGVANENTSSDIKIVDKIEPIRLGDIGSTSQAHRVYSCEGKSVTINAGGGGQGGKTGLYMIRTQINGKETEFPIYEIKDKTITINDKEHPINLEDGFYIIRKLTVKECERLQTIPDGFCGNAGVSPQQCYKAIGNGWTAEVIIHILNHALKDVPRDTPLEVLSMYDGIATGRYCLEKMGFTNIKYVAVEIDKYAKQIALHNYPDIIQIGDAFQVREDDFEEKINKIFKGEN